MCKTLKSELAYPKTLEEFNQPDWNSKFKVNVIIIGSAGDLKPNTKHQISAKFFCHHFK